MEIRMYHECRSYYLYNGKELDRTHGLDLYDYGARRYDPSLGRFMSIDPMYEKYYHISPYAYCGGDPVNHIDPNGRDYDVIINEKNKTITISAKFYVATKDDLNALNEGIDFWNGLHYDIDGYHVSFALTGELRDPSEINYKIEQDYSKSQYLKCLREIDSYNKLHTNENYLGIFNYNDDNMENGITMFGNLVLIKESRRNTPTVMHEIGHAIGAVHYDKGKGIMTTDENSRRHEDLITPIEVKMIIENAKRDEPPEGIGRGHVIFE